MLWFVLAFESVEVAFYAYKVQRNDVTNLATGSIGILVENYQFNTYCISKALFVNHYLIATALTSHSTCIRQVVFARNDLDGIPTFSNAFLPLCNLFGKCIVVSRELAKTKSFLFTITPTRRAIAKTGLRW